MSEHAKLTRQFPEQSMRAYEADHGPFTPTERAALLTMAKSTPERKGSIHPLGHDSTETDPTTPQNRALLKSCLRSYFAGTLASQINQHRDTATGVELADHFVTLLEIGVAVWKLRVQRPDLTRCDKDRFAPMLLIEYRLGEGWSVLEICTRWNFSQSKYYQLEAESIDSMIRSIWA